MDYRFSAVFRLGKGAGLLNREIADVRALGTSEQVTWTQDDAGLTIEPPRAKLSDIAVVFKVTLK